jgi:predicted MFS family arabinose efflux permease
MSSPNHNAVLVGGLLVLRGLSGTVSNLITGRLSDSIGSRKVIVAMLVVLALVMASLPTDGANIWTTAIVISLCRAVAWGSLAPQQHRLVAVAPQSAPVVVGLNTSAHLSGHDHCRCDRCCEHSGRGRAQPFFAITERTVSVSRRAC